MALDIENKNGEAMIQVKNAVAIELIAAIHYLSDRSHHSFSDDLANAMLNHLSIDSLKMLKVLSGMRLQGLELFEFAVKDRAFDDIELLMLKISSYNDVNFIYTLLGEVLEHNTIQQIMNDKQELNKIMQEKPKLARDIKGLEYLFYNTKSFRKDIVNLIKEMNNSVLLNKLDSLQEDYDKHIEKTKIRVKGNKPIDVSQEIMDKKFIRIFDFREYYFIPSYFISPHKIRVFCTDAQMVVFAMELKEKASNEIGDRISIIFKIISDRTRLEILKAIIEESTYGKILAERLNLTTATISHHIEVLKSVNLITERRKKNIKYFEANEAEIKKLFNEGLEYLFER
ncbi:MAG: regulatory protein ArsR [Clostridia bacterium]|nr:regulatory protein ArsR [Clostridia bacterium]